MYRYIDEDGAALLARLVRQTVSDAVRSVHPVGSVIELEGGKPPTDGYWEKLPAAMGRGDLYLRRG